MLGLSVYHHELEALRRGSYEAIKTIKIPHCHHVSPRIYIAAVLPRTSFIKVLSGNQINLVLVLGGGKTSGGWQGADYTFHWSVCPPDLSEPRACFCYFVYGWQSSYNTTAQSLKNSSNFRVCDYYVIKTFVLCWERWFWTNALKERCRRCFKHQPSYWQSVPNHVSTDSDIFVLQQHSVIGRYDWNKSYSLS